MRTFISEEKLNVVKDEIAKMLHEAVLKNMSTATMKMLIDNYEEIQICQRVMLKYGTKENSLKKDC